MEEKLIDSWNYKVKDDDLVYVLGDIVKDDDRTSIEIFKNLKDTST